MNHFDGNSIYVCASAICNLNCPYCYLTKKSNYIDFHKKVMKAWEDGSYVDNIIAVVNKVMYPEKIQNINLWGAETSIGYKLIAKELPRLKKAFPNLSEVFCGTNFIDNIDGLIELIKVAEEQKFTIVRIWLSIDGFDDILSEAGHNVPASIYEHNFDELNKFFANYTFHNLFHIKLLLRATTSFQTAVNNFTDKEKLIKYTTNYYEHYNELIRKFTKTTGDFVQVDMRLPEMDAPTAGTSEEGQKYTEIQRLWENLQQANSDVHTLYYNDIKFGSFMFLNKRLIGSSMLKKGVLMTTPYGGCGSFKSYYAILPDGTFAPCRDFMAQVDDDTIANFKQNDYDLYIASKMNKQYCWNSLKFEDKNTNKEYLDYCFSIGGEKTIYEAMDVAMAHELALSGQINKCYIDQPDLVVNHLFFHSVDHCRTRNNEKTHVSFLGELGKYRAFLNGAGEHEYITQTRDLKKQYGV